MSHSIASALGFHAGTAERPTAAQRLIAAWSRLVAEWRVWHDLQRLAELDGRLLKDIGIGPGSLESAVRHGRRLSAGSAEVRSDRALPHSIMPLSWTEWR